MNIENSIEGEQEKIPTKEEIFALLGINAEKLVGDPKEEIDEKGIKRLKFKIEGKEKGQIIEYLYTRDMKSDERAPHFGKLETDIYETVYDAAGYFVKFPENIYRFQAGTWKKL